MSVPSLRALVLAAAGSLALAGCADYYGHGGGYGYSSVAVGFQSGTAYHRPYYGWYDNFYYPGTGYHVFDRRGVAHRWHPRHRSYWQSHRRFFHDPRAWHHRQPNWSRWDGPPPRGWRPPPRRHRW